MKSNTCPRPSPRLAAPAAALVTTLATTLMLAGCGGGGAETAAPAPAPAPAPTPAPSPSLSLSGVVAKGAAVSGAAISAKCATGSGTATSASDGSYTLAISGGSLPCVLEAVSGTDKLHTAAATEKANITPLTELMVAQMTGQAPAAWFTASTSATVADGVTAAKLSSAQTAVLAVLTAAGVDASKAGDFVSGTLVAANGSAAGSDQDKALDALAAKLVTAGSTLADLATTVAAGSSSASATTVAAASALAPELLLKPAAPTCSALRATDYWVIDTGVTGGAAVQKVRIAIDASKVVSVVPFTGPDSSTLSMQDSTPLTANGSCRFKTGDGSDFVVSPSGVIVGLNDVSQSFVAIPVQAHTLAELAGDWNGFGSDTADGQGGGWTFGYGSYTLSTAGTSQFTQGCWFDGPTSSTCAVIGDASKVKRPVAMLADGSFTVTSAAGESGGPWSDRTFVYRSGQGDYFAIGANVQTPVGKGDGSVSYATKVRTLSLPTVGAVSSNWNVYWNWATGASTTATDVNTHTIQSVDSAAGSFVRISGAAGGATHPETLLVNKPFAGFWQRDAAAAAPTSDGKTTNVRPAIFLRAGGGISVVLQPYQDATRPARIVLSVAQPG